MRTHIGLVMLLAAVVSVTGCQPQQGPASDKAESAALTAALNWIAGHQEADGHWDSEKYVGQKPNHAVTSLALLAFLYAGNTEDAGPHAKSVKRGLVWLLKQQQPDGRIGPHAYEAGVTLMTLIEAYERGGRKDKQLKAAIEKAVAYAVKTQRPTGGWDYKPNGPFTNTGATSWWVQGLVAAKENGIEVPAKTLSKALAYFEKATAEDGSCSYAGRYQSVDEVKVGGGTPFMSAVALNSLSELGSTETAKMSAARARITRRQPDRESRDFYFWAWQIWSLRKQPQTAAWRRLKSTVRPLVVATQVQLGTVKEQKGSWDPGADRYGDQWGRVGETALGAIMLSLLDQ